LGLWEITALALALGADAFSVCVGLGMHRVPPHRTLAFALMLGVVQGAMVAAGYAAAALIHGIVHVGYEWAWTIGSWAGDVDPESIHEQIHHTLTLLGACVLAAVGINLITSFFGGKPPARSVRSGASGLVAVAFVVNIDALTAGLGMGMLEGVPILLAVLVMVALGLVLADLGLVAGRRIGRRIGRVAKPLGGAILVLIAVRTIVTTI